MRFRRALDRENVTEALSSLGCTGGRSKGRYPHMSDEVSLSSVARRLRVPSGPGLGGFIYGTILVLSVLVAAARAYPHEPGHIAALVAVTSFVFWLAHVYAHGHSYSVAADEHLSLAELRRIAGREGSIVGAALLPVAALLLGAFGLVSTRAAVWAAFGVGLAALVVEGIIFARVERMGALGTLAIVTANLALGAALVGLKLLVNHF
jgi:hypothetical protein